MTSFQRVFLLVLLAGISCKAAFQEVDPHLLEGKVCSCNKLYNDDLGWMKNKTDDVD